MVWCWERWSAKCECSFVTLRTGLGSLEELQRLLRRQAGRVCWSTLSGCWEGVDGLWDHRTAAGPQCYHLVYPTGSQLFKARSCRAGGALARC